MGDLFYSDLVEVLAAAGVVCRVTDVNEGWERRSRSSGGFAAPPLGIWWHHTASSASPESDLNWMINGSDDAPIGNMLLDRSGVVWPIAAGASNCAGSGGPWTFSRGTVPEDSGNSQGWQIEAANNGVGEPWPVAQIDAYFAVNEALAARFGNLPTDCVTHQLWAPSRKIDPATAAAVEGPWRPGSVTPSGTWSLYDVHAEALRRHTTTPIPPTPGGDDMATSVLILDDVREPFPRYRCDGNTKTWIDDGHASAQLEYRLAESQGGRPSPVDGMVYVRLEHGGDDVIGSYGPIVGPVPPGRDVYGRRL